MPLEPINVVFFEKRSVDGYCKMPRVHYHNKHEFYFLEKGQTKFFVDTEIFILEPGDMIFVPANTLHRTENLETESNCRSILYFNDSDFENELTPFIEKLKTRRLIKIHYKKMHHIEKILSDIAMEEETQNDGYFQMQKLYMKQLLIMIERYCTDNVENSLSSSYKVAENISKYIRENYNEDLSLANLSVEFSMTPTYLSRFFKKSTGISLNEYINIVRIKEAENLLKNSDMAITEVAFACGFNDSNYFSSVFKKAKGITPKKFSMINRL